ncbi:purine-cytosine permease-like protein [Tamaricihabitans halophyticus]|uniref:Purine-cytosine permease-like protein n=1 Tax=Tamaricihabitans halophyticus TaxID=1262583 RepID=A0A4R2QKI1_9PSEU|nr:cytosine permease [Tamaricihabitans halophyticus]TCP49359.1 purine-cytosine permease-like protein [Tamaricihabitans halophyticus]
MSDNSLRGRVGAEVETVGIRPIPDEQRTMRPYRMFIVWLMAASSATTPLVGDLLYDYGMTNFVIAALIAWLIALIPAGLFSEMGRQTPLTALVVARRTFGWSGAFGFSALFTVVNLGWFGLNTAVGASILAAITDTSFVLWCIVVGGVQIVLVVFGMKWLERFYRYTTALMIICYGALVVYLALNYELTWPEQQVPMNWGSALTIILSFSILSWTYKLSTVSRFAVPVERTGGSRASYFLSPAAGVMVALIGMGVVGIYSKAATGEWNIALLGQEIEGWGIVAAIGVAVAVVQTNAMNLYPAMIDLLVALNTVRRPWKWEQPIASVLLGVVGITLAVIGILDNAADFLEASGKVIIPFTFIMLVDWIAVQRRKTPSEEFFRAPRGFAERWRLDAVGACAVGVLIGFFGERFLPAFSYEVLPLPVVAGVVAAALFWLFALPRIRAARDNDKEQVGAN